MTNPASIIDPPITPYSPPAKIEAWIKELKTYEQNRDVLRATEQAEEYLAESRANQR